MRVMAATYVGNMMADENMTYWGDHWADEAIAEFDKYGTLSEVRVQMFRYTPQDVCSTFALVQLWHVHRRVPLRALPLRIHAGKLHNSVACKGLDCHNLGYCGTALEPYVIHTRRSI